MVRVNAKQEQQGREGETLPIPVSRYMLIRFLLQKEILSCTLGQATLLFLGRVQGFTPVPVQTRSRLLTYDVTYRL